MAKFILLALVATTAVAIAVQFAAIDELRTDLKTLRGSVVERTVVTGQQFASERRARRIEIQQLANAVTSVAIEAGARLEAIEKRLQSGN
jgi:hypothetical protein